MTEAELCQWLDRAKPGTMLMYHRGHLAFDIWSAHSNLTRPEKDALFLLASRALWADKVEGADLVQRKQGVGDYMYFIIARKCPATFPKTAEEWKAYRITLTDHLRSGGR